MNLANTENASLEQSNPGRPMLTDAERRQALAEWNSTAVAYPGKRLCLHQLIEEQAARTPDQVALVFEQQRLTYGELNRRADQLAHHLRGLGAGPDVLVGLFVERSLEMVVGILGVLKAGAAYVPIDAVYPRERIAFMLTDANVTLVLTQATLLPRLPSGAAQAVCLDSFDWNGRKGPEQSNVRVHPEHAAYVIFTSGSTGRPKGVCIEHRNIVNYVLGIVERLRLEPGMNHATVSTIAADLGNTVIFPALATGGCLHVISQQRAENQGMLSDYFVRESIDVLKIVPSHLAALQAGKRPEQVMPRRRLILGGEASRLEWVERLRALSPDCEIYNHYGPTETTVGVLTYKVGPRLPSTQSGTLPLGRPLPNSRVYILDERGQPVPVGVQGELCIGGDGVARGYLNRPDQTAERFVPDPFGSDAGGRLYRTGDRARHLADGNIEFCGRIDHQVKIRGYRIELGEIEEALREHRGVRDAVVLASEDESGSKQVAAYVVPERASQALWESKALYVLPDGSPVAHLNKNETDYIYHEIFVLQAYLRYGITVNDGDRIVDVGANIGLFTVFASRLARNLRITSFEPNPAAFACLSANAEAWGTGVKCLPLGISSENKSAQLTFFEGLSLLSGFYPDAAKEREVVKNYVFNQDSESQNDQRLAAEVGELIDQRLRARTESAQLRTLSSVIAQEGIDRIDLLKVNVEKSELDVLLGIDSGDWPKIRQMVIEVDLQENVAPITALLEQHGYEVLVEQDPLLRKTDLCYVYAIRPSATGPRLIRQQPANAHVRSLPAVDEEILTPITLRKYLRERLPQYMVPSAFVLMEKLPLTPNGKIDRQALPALSRQNLQAAPDFVRPHTETEKALAAIWSELLKVESIGLSDDFFELGGHSLLAIKAVSRIRDLFEVALPTSTLFENPTIAGLSRALADAKGSSGSAVRIEPRKQGGPCPLSFAQEQLWFLDQLAPGSPVYNIVDFVRVDGRFDPAAMRRTMQELVRRHEILRTAISNSSGRPMQIVLPTVDLVLPEIDLSALAEHEREREWRRVVREQGRNPFELSQAPLLRAAVAHWSHQEHRLLLTIHHIVADEWSMDLIHQEVKRLYEAFAQGRPSPLAELPIQYADFACWQRDWLQGEMLQRQIAYWKEELAGAPSVLELPTDKPRPAVQSFRGATEIFGLPETLLERLKSLGRQEQATLFMILEAAFMALLNRYTGQADILVGTPITGRTRSETEGLIGYFLNTVVLRARFSERVDFRSLLQQVRQRALGAYAHPDLPFAQLVAELAPVRDPSRTPLFQVQFVLHNADGVSQVSKVSGHHALETGTSKFDLTLYLSETGNRLEGVIEYSTDLFEAETIRRMCGHYATLLEAIASDPDRSISTLPMLTDVERRQLLAEWSGGSIGFAADGRSLHERFEAQVDRAPEAVAASFEGQALTYLDLNQRANRLAHYLRERGVEPDVRVGLCMERSLDLVVGLLGILKAGGAYVPLDPAYPADRLSFLVADAGIKLLVTQQSCLNVLPTTQAEVVCLDRDWPQISRRSDSNLPGTVRPGHLAYVIYTSGSTGKPKGALITHRNVTRLFEATEAWYHFDQRDVWTLFHSYAFDFSVWELWGALLYGGRVVAVPYWVSRSPEAFRELLIRERVTVLNQTPSAFGQLVQADLAQPQAAFSLRYVIFGGEALNLQSLRPWFQRHGDEKPLVVNMYGITETTVHVTYRPIRLRDVESGAGSVIGVPIPDLRIYVLDARGQPVPIGVPGELYVGGAGVARGYLNRADLTEQRFVRDPFNLAGDSRLYRSGDLVRWRAGRDLEYLGRLDFQVKVRGFRVELGEIEAGIARHPAIREVVVLAREDAPGDKRLVAYFVAENPPADLVNQLRALIRASLPEYMVPAHFVCLDTLPLTENGKVDRKALPAPEGAANAVRAYEAPVGAIETALARIWADVLKLERVGRHDQFFELGGHSLLAVSVIERMRREGLRADVRALFVTPTLSALAAAVGEGSGIVEVPPNRIPPGCDVLSPEMLPLVQLESADIERIVSAVPGGAANVQDIYPLTPLQEGILFHSLMATEGDVYLTSSLFAFDSRERLDAYLRALQAAIDRHDILRTAVLWEGLREPVQAVWRKASLIVEEVKLEPAFGDATQQLRARFDPRHYRLALDKAPLLRLFVAHDAASGRWIALHLHHHLGGDNTSLKLLFAEVHAHLLGEAEQLPAPLPFRNFVAQARLGVSPKEHEAFFQKMLGDVDEPTAPLGLTDVQGDGSGIAEARRQVDAALAGRLRACARSLGVSAATLCHVAWAQVLARTSGRDDVVFGTVLFGRMQGGAGAHRALGMFINTLPVRIRVGEDGVEESVRRTHATLAQLMRHEHAPLALAQRCSAVAAPAPLFTALLNYRHSQGSASDSTGGLPAWEGIEFLGFEERTNYPLSLDVDDLGEGFVLTAQAQTPVDPARICAYMHCALEQLLKALESAPATSMRSLDVLPPAERRQLLVEWNATQAAYPHDKCIHELFEAQAARHPEAIALVHEERQLTYGELNARANQLARHLVRHGVGPEVMVGLCVERSLDMVVGILGILKAGGAYVPLDRDYPAPRLAFMLEDTAVPVLLTQAKLRDRLPAYAGRTISLDADWSQIAPEATHDLGVGVSAGNLAYVIYTSGSTGTPKGVMVEHRAVCNEITAVRERCGLTAGDRVLQFCSINFDASVEEVFGALLSGAALVLRTDAWLAGAREFWALCERYQVSVVDLPTRFWQELAVDRTGVIPATLRLAIVGGEAADHKAVQAWLTREGHRPRLLNSYGPTETTIAATFDEPALGDVAPQSIGRPIANTRIYLLGLHGQPVPRGVAGEIHIGGAGLARGYLNRPELTAERFIVDPFAEEPGVRMYRTGDLARYLPDGEIEFLGRNDFQLKIRGFRIELGEIEAAMVRHPAIREAVVLAREDGAGDKRLVAYYTPNDAPTKIVDAEALRGHLSALLPEYMVPAVYVALETLPLTRTGKLDREALPPPSVEDMPPRAGAVAPRTASEEMVFRVFRGALDRTDFGVFDNFFALGGHSLVAARLMSRLRSASGLNLPLRSLFERPTVAGLAEAIDGLALPASATEQTGLLGNREEIEL